MEDIVVIAVLLCLVGGVARYLYKAKKRGQGCIGCPYSKQCGSQCTGCCDEKKIG